MTDLMTTASSARRAVSSIFAGLPASDGAGVKLTRLIGQPRLPDLDPFLMLDHFGSDDPDAYIGGFPSHPHRGFETVTYMLAGRMRHNDHLGNEGQLDPGSVQWMTAGRGIIHSEMPEQIEGLLSGFQLWINLPARDKMTAPRYQDIPPEAIPTVDLGGGGSARLVAGSLAGRSGPVEAGATAPLFVDLALQPGSSATIPVNSGHNGFAYVYEGSGDLGTPAIAIAAGQLAILGDGAILDVTAGRAGARLLVVAGKPIGEPVAKYGPFVMTTDAEIREAIADFRAGRFAG
ncbi:MAG: pirin family protein [Ancalomicrobiaceae bacterium]|nr:pirin family protein [Ancalomicrobiaceae bacterium]